MLGPLASSGGAGCPRKRCSPTPEIPGRGIETRRTEETTGAMASQVLVARGVGKTYRAGGREIPALVDVGLEIPRGAFVSVAGPSGSGKTTLLHCLSGLDSVDVGTVEIEGEDVHALPERRRAAQRARLMGFVFLSLNLLPVLSVAENVELPLMLRRRPAKEARGAALAALERVGLPDVADRRARSPSSAAASAPSTRAPRPPRTTRPPSSRRAGPAANRPAGRPGSAPSGSTPTSHRASTSCACTSPRSRRPPRASGSST